jgi:phage gp46-like protein
MAGLDLKRDPITKDYVDNGRGGLVYTQSIETQVYNQIHCRKNEWVADPELGNTAHLIPKKSSLQTMQRYRESYLEALQYFITEGLAEDLVLTVDRNQKDQLSIRGSLRDAQFGDINLQNVFPVGAGG